MEDSSFFGLPHDVKRTLFENKRIKSLYEWQTECLTLIVKETPRNVLYMAPTSGGKTLVAEILSIKELLVNKKNVLLILPFVSIVHEKVQSFSSLALNLGYLVEEYAGTKGTIPPIKRIKKKSIFICTIEKSLVLINSLIEENRLSEIGLAVVDELHLIGDKSRGPTLENAISKLLISKIRIIGMSATIGNPESLVKFLDGVIYCSTFRPTQLSEFVVVKDEIFEIKYLKTGPHISLKSTVKTGMVVYLRALDETPKSKQILTDSSKECRLKGARVDYPELACLLMPVIPQQSCLIFCQTKKTCENICKIICSILSEIDLGLLNHKQESKLQLIKAMTEDNNGQIDKILKSSIKYGIAYHHSGLTFSERKFLEDSFTDGTLCCLCCTSTLAAGVNLPAQRVILRAPMVGKDFITLSQYKQMAGRAGRTGFGDHGEVFTLCPSELANQFWVMISGKIDSIQSQMTVDDVAELMMSLLHLKMAKNKNKMSIIMKKTFLYFTIDGGEKAFTEILRNASLKLTPHLLHAKPSEVCPFIMTLKPFGEAIAKGNIDLGHVLALEDDLNQALNRTVLLSDLHLLYIIAPISISNDLNIPYETFTSIFTKLSKEDLVTANAIGITEGMLQKILCGLPVKNLPKRVINKFLVALILQKLISGENIWAVSEAYKLERGFINSIVQSSASSCSSIIRFCQNLKKYERIRLLLEPLPEKINLTYSGDLAPLMQLPGVRKGRAKQLYDAGFKSVKDIARSDEQKLVSAIPYLRLKQAVEMINVSKMLALAESEALREEADSLMEAAYA